jgi:peroxiredoxin
MKKTDRPKYITLAICCVALATFAAGYQTIAAFISIPAIFVIGFTPNKSGLFFTVAVFFSMFTTGFLVDYPYNKFPAASISLPAVPLILHIRTWFFEKLAIYKVRFFELITLQIACLGFFAGAFIAGYSWSQWVAGGIPALLYLLFSVVIYQDRNIARLMVEKMDTKPGKQAPDFILPDQNGNEVSLKSILEKNHALLIFVRGDWCPTCHMMMRGYIKNKEKFMEKNVRIIGIGPDPVGVNRDLMNRIDESSVMLSDADQQTAFKYSGALQDNNPSTKNMYQNGIPLPASFLVHMNGNIIYTSRSDKAAEILQPDKIFEVLASI